jgi:hypothetical protein
MRDKVNADDISVQALRAAEDGGGDLQGPAHLSERMSPHFGESGMNVDKEKHLKILMRLFLFFCFRT